MFVIILSNEKKSFKHRIGYASFFKINESQLIPINDKDIHSCSTQHDQLTWSAQLQQTINDFNEYLSKEPYARTGIPIYSTLMQGTEHWRILEIYLNCIFNYRDSNPDSKKNKYGTLGMYYEEKNCNDDPQKRNCDEWNKCRGYK